MTETKTAKRMMPRRIETIQLPKPFEEFTVGAFLNFPPSVGKDMQSGDTERVTKALSTIIVSHDLVDFAGEPYPPADDPAFWDEIPSDVGAILLQTVLGRVGRLDPKSAGR